MGKQRIPNAVSQRLLEQNVREEKKMRLFGGVNPQIPPPSKIAHGRDKRPYCDDAGRQITRTAVETNRAGVDSHGVVPCKVDLKVRGQAFRLPPPTQR